MPPHQRLNWEAAITREKKRSPALMAFGASANTFKTGCGNLSPLATLAFGSCARRDAERISQSFSVCPRPLLSADIRMIPQRLAYSIHTRSGRVRGRHLHCRHHEYGQRLGYGARTPIIQTAHERSPAVYADGGSLLFEDRAGWKSAIDFPVRHERPPARYEHRSGAHAYAC